MNNLRENLLNLDTWLRFLLIVVFCVVRYLLIALINLLIVVQFALVLFTGEKNEKLCKAGIILNTYLLQIVDYQTFSSDVLPWPWSNFPDDSRDPDTTVVSDDLD